MDARSRISRALMPIGLIAASLALAVPAAAATTCAGRTPTIVGTYGDDVIVGTNGDDVIDGLGGDDVIDGLDGNDIICGNNGRDVIHGGDGDDLILGGSSIDTLYGDAGNDHLRGNTGRDRLFGGPNDDRLYGGVHADRLRGEGGNDLLFGGHDRDDLSGGFGDDMLYGGVGNDSLRGDAGSDILDGEEGIDVADGGDGFDRCEADDPAGCEDDLNDAPDAVDDHFVTDENIALFGNLFDDNGAGPDGDPNADPIHVTAVDGTPIDGAATIALSSGATITVAEDGSFSYEAGAGYDGLEAGAAAADEFTYTVADPKGETDDATVAVVVGGANDDPIAADDEDGTDEDTRVDVDVLANDGDPEEHELDLVSVDTTGLAGTVVMNPDNTVRYTPPAAFDALAEGDEVEEVFTYTATDGFGGMATATVTVYVEGANDAPVAGDDSVTVDEDAAVVIDVLANDADPDAGDVIAASLATPASHGTVTAHPCGGFTYTPDPDFAGTDSFTYTVEDMLGATAVGTVSITVTPINDAPTAVDDVATVAPGSMTIILVLANDTDVDGDDLTVTIVDGPEHGSVVVLSNGALAYTSDSEFSGIDTLTYQVTDAGAITDTATVSVTVSN